MSSVDMPPIVRAWTQNFQWSMGIVYVGAFQRLSTWFLRATGGHPDVPSVAAELDMVRLQRRSNETSSDSDGNQVYVGIRRVGYVASIEAFNLFMTVYIAFALVMLAQVVLVLILKTAFRALVRKGRVPGSGRLQECIRFWALLLKGMLLRTVSLRLIFKLGLTLLAVDLHSPTHGRLLLGIRPPRFLR